MRRKRILKEATSKLEVAIAKSLNQAPLLPSELEEIAVISTQELISDHGLDYLLAEKIKVHVKTEYYRQRAQSHMTWQLDNRDKDGGFTRTYPVTESKKIFENPAIELPQFLSDESDEGRMLDYGEQKSDSNEGRMIRQALFEMAQYAQELHDLLEDNDDLPQWCHYKIATARSGLGKVKHYLEYKIIHSKD
jgi:hypothetical protein